MMRVKTTIAVAVLFVAITAVAGFSEEKSAPPAGIKMQEVAIGHVFTDSNGMTLYTYDADNMPGKSTCNGVCAQNWPPVAASGDASSMGDWSVVTRDDGSKQWAYKGKPLYRFAKDEKAGDTKGEGFKNVWHVAKP